MVQQTQVVDRLDILLHHIGYPHLVMERPLLPFARPFVTHVFDRLPDEPIRHSGAITHLPRALHPWLRIHHTWPAEGAGEDPHRDSTKLLRTGVYQRTHI